MMTYFLYIYVYVFSDYRSIANVTVIEPGRVEYPQCHLKILPSQCDTFIQSSCTSNIISCALSDPNAIHFASPMIQFDSSGEYCQ